MKHGSLPPERKYVDPDILEGSLGLSCGEIQTRHESVSITSRMKFWTSLAESMVTQSHRYWSVRSFPGLTVTLVSVT
jgi:hypothetical protein